MTIEHPIPPLYDERSKILILGSFPSVKSREVGFFYGHKQNRFWRVVSSLLKEPLPETVEEKKALLLSHGIALYDAIDSCEITGSADSSIKNAAPTDLSPIFRASEIHAVFCNGKTSYALFETYQKKATGREAILLPSTSPANATFSLEKLIESWTVIVSYL